MKSSIYSKFAWALALTFATATGVSQPVEGTVTAEECSKELLLSFFPEQFVNEVLTKYQVPKDKAAAIVKELSDKDRDIVKIVEEKAAKIDPNPLKDPQQRQAAVKIFRETLLTVFSDAAKKNGISDDKQIQAMLDEIQQLKAKRFAECIEKQRGDQAAQPAKDAPAPAQSNAAGAHQSTGKTQASANSKDSKSEIADNTPAKSNPSQANAPANTQEDSDDEDDDDDDDDDDEDDDTDSSTDAGKDQADKKAEPKK